MPSSNLRPIITNDVAQHTTVDSVASTIPTDYDPRTRGRSLDLFTNQLTNIFQGVDIGAVGKILAVAVIGLIIYDMLVYTLASTSSRKRLLITPWLTQVLAGSWDDFLERSSFARSDDTLGNIVQTLASAAEQYGSKWEKSRLL